VRKYDCVNAVEVQPLTHANVINKFITYNIFIKKYFVKKKGGVIRVALPHRRVGQWHPLRVLQI
jgi:hypothetical protein